LTQGAGVLALWKGVVPAMARGMVYGGLRLGLYAPIKDALHTSNWNDSWSTYKKIAAGMGSGGMAAAITNPTELVTPPPYLFFLAMKSQEWEVSMAR
jgi:hypothetical protein